VNVALTTAHTSPVFLWNLVSERRFFPMTLGEHMLSKTIAMVLLTTALLTGVASAQSTTNKWDTTNTAIVTKMQREGEWRASKLAGVSVYNESNEKIGDVNDVILGKSDNATKVILGVGGFSVWESTTLPSRSTN
jgi:hypothetical protein